MADYSNISDEELERKVKAWKIIQPIALVLFGVGFLAWLFIDSWRSPIVFILLMGSISTIILILGNEPRKMEAELKKRQSE